MLKHADKHIKVIGSGNGNEDDTSNLNNTFLRGLQATDSDGVAQFTTIFPGHYAGRATHMHVVSHIGGTVLSNGTYTGGNVTHIGMLTPTPAVHTPFLTILLQVNFSSINPSSPRSTRTSRPTPQTPLPLSTMTPTASSLKKPMSMPTPSSTGSCLVMPSVMACSCGSTLASTRPLRTRLRQPLCTVLMAVFSSEHVRCCGGRRWITLPLSTSR